MCTQWAQQTLNLVVEPVFLIFTDLASVRRAVSRNCLISVIWRGCSAKTKLINFGFFDSV